MGNPQKVPQKVLPQKVPQRCHTNFLPQRCHTIFLGTNVSGTCSAPVPHLFLAPVSAYQCDRRQFTIWTTQYCSIGSPCKYLFVSWWILFVWLFELDQEDGRHDNQIQALSMGWLMVRVDLLLGVWLLASCEATTSLARFDGCRRRWPGGRHRSRWRRCRGSRGSAGEDGAAGGVVLPSHGNESSNWMRNVTKSI